MLSIKNLTKIYSGNKKAVDNISLDIQSGEFIAFIGTSGSGKTTALRMINRMIEATDGQIMMNGKDVRNMNPVELRRSIGYVIQQIGLMPHMTIQENIVLVPKLLKWSKEKKDEKAKELIKLVDLPEEYLDRYPAELSGGQQQRIGVVRALAAEQDIILMDEPFGALDPITRDTLQDLVKELQQKLGKTFILSLMIWMKPLNWQTKYVLCLREKSFNTIHLTIFYDILQMTLLEILLGKIA